MTYATHHLAGAWLLWIVGLSLGTAGCSQHDRGAPAGSGYATRSSSGDISFEVTPRGMVGGRFVVDIRANTHHGDLAELDLARVVTLAASGKELSPVQADRLQGHHSAGQVAFGIESPPARFEIVVRGARDLPERRFQWP